jgi:hypothetical protein
MMQILWFVVGALAAAVSPLIVSPSAEAARAKPQPPAPAQTAAEPARSLGSAGSWTAYMSKDKTGRVCYVYGQPQRTEPAGARRKSPMMMITHRPEEKIANVVSVMEGYPLKEGSDVVIDVGAAKFDLFAKEDSAWARTSELDKTIVSTMAKGKQAIVKGSPPKGTGTTDTYALAGFGKAMALIDKACGVKR